MNDRTRPATASVGRILSVATLLLVAGRAGAIAAGHGRADHGIDGPRAGTALRRTTLRRRRPRRCPSWRPLLRQQHAAVPGRARRRPVLTVTSVLRL